ncbi:DUF4883 family protein [Clostridium algidicarnis]|uniref:DUF4883 family protein n=1 Tax=Clostridium algidicarnis TaxID=37659 RepID=UPI001C0C2218|nr:DUF4883 family protein [Clostridium algidicarnis]MBU3209134.1 DUF4883 family protein [Clostridium algidicarnis]MBU3229029.1 DUF4883 family protein [Clostridium algidicarnis]MBU3252552.1 DUF4883 family protein [Clostridium algidicarnis]
MKLPYIIISIIISSVLLVSCTFSETNLPISPKPSNHFYTENLFNSLDEYKEFSSTLYETNLHKESSLDKEDLEVLTNFFSSLNTDDFIDEPYDIDKSPSYKIFITINSMKYVINIYDADFISIYPWDGNKQMDFISMKNIPVAYNLYNFCKYKIDKPL